MQEIEITQIEKQFWVLHNLYKANTAYNIPSVIRFQGIPELESLEFAINEVTARHEALRSCFTEEKGRIFQKIAEPRSFAIRIDSIPIAGEYSDERLPREVMEEIHKLFILEEYPLFRVKLFVLADGTSLMTVVFHHIIIDLRSKEIFEEEFSAFYNMNRSKTSSEINIRKHDYSDYSKWESGWIASGEAEKTGEEWKKFIPVLPENLELPVDFPRPKINDLSGRRKHFALGGDLSAKISGFARENSVSPFTVLLTAYAIFLHRITGQSSFITGIPLTNRRNQDFKDTFGCFVNIVPLAIDCDGKINGISLLRQIRHSLLISHRIQEYPFIKINDLLKRNGSGSIIQCGFTFEHPMKLTLKDIESAPVIVEKEGSQLDLFLTFWEEALQFNAYLEYSSLLFRPETSQRFIDIFRRVTAAFLDSPEMPVDQLDMLPSYDKDLIASWNSTDHSFSDNICLHTKLEEQVRINPDLPAVRFGNSVLTYAEFDKHVNRLANKLISSGLKVEDFVCVCLERSPELLIAIYAILKAGGAYLPVDPGYPAERMESILSDAKPMFILTNRNSDRNLPPAFKRIYLDNILASADSGNEMPPSIKVEPENLAYLLYTSGSTGKPKGVMIAHRSVVNKLEWMQHQHKMTHDDVIMLKTPVTFDVSVWEIFWWIFCGASVSVLPPGGEKDPAVIIDEVYSKKVTAIVFVPSMFSPFVSYVRANNLADRLSGIKWIIQIGEALTPQLVKAFNAIRTERFNPLLVNTYGPTEATVAVSWYNCPDKGEIEKIYIGKPIFNTKLLVVNPDGMLQPPGIPGELVISGTNLARGYLNRPELNAEKFIELEYFENQKLRGYRTGDLVKWAEDGNIEFIGRTDAQVKIRGYRIELGEIESKLIEHPDVKLAAVVVRQENPDNKIIIGYVVLRSPGSSTKDDILRFLSLKVPQYMIPAALVIMEHMPLNTSGKIDRKALPVPDLASSHPFVAPASAYEKKLQSIWRKTLGIEDIGITHNFFDIGGNSLRAISLVSSIREELGLVLEPLHIMEFPTIRALAKFMTGNEKEIPADSGLDSDKTRTRNYRLLKERRSR